MKFGEQVTLMIETLDEKGRGIGPISVQGQLSTVKSQKWGLVPGVIPGETVEASFIGRDKGRLRLAEPRLISASPDRVSPPCPHAGTCGGCSVQYLRYARQAELKRLLVDRSFAEAGLALKTEAIVPALKEFHHRNRMDYAFGPDGALGLKEAGRWDRYVDLGVCLMLSEEAVEVMRRTKAWAASTGHRAWDNRKHQGFLRYLVIREGVFTGERMITLVTALGDLEKEAELVAALAPLCTTLYHGINPLVTDLSIARELRLLHGAPHLREKISGITYLIHPNSFFQTNSGMARILLEHVRALMLKEPCGRLLDLYCGSGFFSLALAGNVMRALGIELDPHGIEMAKLNAGENGIENVEYRAEAAEALSWSLEKPDLVIVDPPRSGLHPKVKKTLLQHLPPRIIYVSCGPRALAADLKELCKAYDPVSTAAFDLFPQTMHVETVVELKKRSDV